MFGLWKPANTFGVGFFILQALRVATVISLAAAGTGCWILIINVDKYKAFFVFQCISLFFTSLGCLGLIIAEFPVIQFVKNFYLDCWPVLSDEHGVAWLGFAMIAMGSHILGSLNQQGYDTDKFDGPFAQLVLASGILSITFGAFNIICALIFRDGKQGINSRHVRASGSLAGQDQQLALPSYNTTPDASIHNEKLDEHDHADIEARPRPVISGPLEARGYDQMEPRHSPIAPGIKRPDTALHPIHTRRSSRYSTANISQF